jgi:diguanylate cyclase (GGDEF)-like protein
LTAFVQAKAVGNSVGAEHFRAALDSLADGFAIMTSLRDTLGTIVDFRFDYLNDAACGCHQLNRDELVGRLASQTPGLLWPTGALSDWAAVVDTGLPVVTEWLTAPDAPSGGRCPPGRAFELRATKLGDGLAVLYRDVTATKHAAEQLAHQALHDPLTGLANRALAMDRLALAINQLDRASGLVAVLYLDLDHFKDVNDRLGHRAGDEVLRQVAHRLGPVMRALDTLARLGGDEFLIVSPGLPDEVAANAIAHRVVASLDEPVWAGGKWVQISASVGVAVTGSPLADPEELVAHADLAMYDAKRRGRHGTELYDSSLQNQVVPRVPTLDYLRSAIDEERLVLHYQPVIDLGDGHIAGAEALLRIVLPDGSLVYPDTFIGYAEDSELIFAVSDWVLRQACSQLASWGPPDGFRLSVNISGREVATLMVADRVLAAIAEARVRPECLSVEMATRALIEGGPSAVAALRPLAENGVSLAIDDFGTGFSSLGSLQSFPIETLKIDRSFVAGVGRRKPDTAIVAALATMARSLYMTVVAKGVERADQLDDLRRLGCQHAQGFVLGRPAPAKDMAELLQAGPG